MAVLLTNSFEGNTSGATITTGNSAAGGSAFNATNIGSGASATYDNAQAAHGGMSFNCTTGSPAANSILEWTSSLTGTSIAQLWFRAYVYLTSSPATQLRVTRAVNGTTYCGGPAITPAGNVALLNAAGVTQNTSTTVLPLSSWFRIEGFVIGSATVGQVQAKIFLSPDSVTPTETVTSTANLNTNAAITRVDFGDPSSVANYTFWLDDIGASDTGYLGPFVPSGQTIIGTTPVLIAAAPPSGYSGQTGRLTVTSGTGTIYVGGPNVSPASGAAVSTYPFTAHLFGGDQIYAVTGTGTAAITVLQNGA